jgi:hypothetical protein
MGKQPTASEVVLRLTLAGRHEEAAKIAAQVIEHYREDPTGDGTREDGTCNDCGYVFTDGDCQHGEFEPFILCDRCYLNRGGR